MMFRANRSHRQRLQQESPLIDRRCSFEADLFDKLNAGSAATTTPRAHAS
jgi:hypothetical protein